MIQTDSHSNNDSLDEVLTFVEQRLPGARVLIRAGSNLTLAVPRSIAAVIPEFLRVLEGKLVPVADGIADFGIANSTLEEVFLNITQGERAAGENTFSGTNEIGINFGTDSANQTEKNGGPRNERG